MRTPFLSCAILCTSIISYTVGFRSQLGVTARRKIFHSSTQVFQAVRYGPPSEGRPGMPVPPTPEQKSAKETAFRNLLENVMAVKDANHVPSLLTKNTDLILSMDAQEVVSVVQSILDEANRMQDVQVVSRLEEAIDLTMSFAEDFVNTASSLDMQYKELLGRIMKAMSNKDIPVRDREDQLEELFEAERQNFSPGFLRHLDGECDKIARSPVMNPDSARTLEMLRVIQSRVLMEVGQEMGDGALVLGQLIGYDDEAERTAILEAGLVVRGLGFAMELRDLTLEALDGFSRVPAGKADPDLIRTVQSIDDALKRYIERETGFE